MPPPVCRRRDLIVTRRIEDEVVLVPIERDAGDLEHIYKLNEVAAFLWEHLDGKRDLAALESEVLAEFEADAATVHRDVAAFLEQLAENKLIEYSQSARISSPIAL